MPGSRQTQITVALVVIGAVLALVAVATAVPDWAIVVLFVAAAIGTYVWWPNRSSND